MKLATTTGDFAGYTDSQTDCAKWIAEAGFRYLDYNFGMDFACKNGAFGEDWRGELAAIRTEAEARGPPQNQSNKRRKLLWRRI